MSKKSTADVSLTSFNYFLVCLFVCLSARHLLKQLTIPFRDWQMIILERTVSSQNSDEKFNSDELRCTQMYYLDPKKSTLRCTVQSCLDLILGHRQPWGRTFRVNMQWNSKRKSYLVTCLMLIVNCNWFFYCQLLLVLSCYCFFLVVINLVVWGDRGQVTQLWVWKLLRSVFKLLKLGCLLIKR